MVFIGAGFKLAKGAAEHMQRPPEDDGNQVLDGVLMPIDGDTSDRIANVQPEAVVAAADSLREQARQKTRRVGIAALAGVVIVGSVVGGGIYVLNKGTSAVEALGNGLAGLAPSVQPTNKLEAANLLLSSVTLPDSAIVADARVTGTLGYETSVDFCAPLVGCKTIPGTTDRTVATVSGDIQVINEANSLTLTAEPSKDDPTQPEIHVKVDTSHVTVQLANETTKVDGERGWTSRVANPFSDPTSAQLTRGTYVVEKDKQAMLAGCGKVLTETSPLPTSPADTVSTQGNQTANLGNAVAGGTAKEVVDAVKLVNPLLAGVPSAKQFLDDLLSRGIIIDFGAEDLTPTSLHLPPEITSSTTKVGNVTTFVEAQGDCNFSDQARVDMADAAAYGNYKIENTKPLANPPR